MLLHQIPHEQVVVCGCPALNGHRVPPNAISKQGTRHDYASKAALEHSDREVPILVAGDRHHRIEAANRKNRLPPHQRGRANRVLDEKPPETSTTVGFHR